MWLSNQIDTLFRKWRNKKEKGERKNAEGRKGERIDKKER